MQEDRERQKWLGKLDSIGLTEDSFGAFDDADQARLRQILNHPLHYRLFHQLANTEEFSIPVFLRQPEVLQDYLVRYANQVVLLIKHVMPFEKLLAMSDELRLPMIEWGREVKKIVHDYRVPLDALLALDETQRMDLIVNANYFSTILKAPEAERAVEQLLAIGNLGLTEREVLIEKEKACKALQTAMRAMYHQQAGAALPAEIIEQIALGVRNPTLIGPDEARRITDNTVVAVLPSSLSAKK